MDDPAAIAEDFLGNLQLKLVKRQPSQQYRTERERDDALCNLAELEVRLDWKTRQDNYDVAKRDHVLAARIALAQHGVLLDRWKALPEDKRPEELRERILAIKAKYEVEFEQAQ